MPALFDGKDQLVVCNLQNPECSGVRVFANPTFSKGSRNGGSEWESNLSSRFRICNLLIIQREESAKRSTQASPSYNYRTIFLSKRPAAKLRFSIEFFETHKEKAAGEARQLRSRQSFTTHHFGELCSSGRALVAPCLKSAQGSL